MITVILRSMMITSIRDKISLFYALVFPLIIMVVLASFFDKNHANVTILTSVTAIGTMFWGMQGIAFQVFSQKNKGVYQLLKLTPVSPIIFISIMILARTAIGVVLNMGIWIIGMIYFKLDFSYQSILLPVPIIIIATLCFTAFGFVIGHLAKNEGQVNMLANFIQLPLLFLSEAFYSLQQAPEWIQAIAKILPFGYFTEGLKGAVTAGQEEVLLGMLVPFIYMLFALLMAVFTFKRGINFGNQSFLKKKTAG
ncbi:ABC transporter permease [Cytobacillus purgationiresistens]|uniref:Transport permease protein n=1 Tax=Cytobacillus purgationiresistens TaxID=863449 RepID=A0ABU0ACU6_9BACI|nr:ABC transporter permease [Cytobacillus purgationiresistens]MDQ0269068.1 ABC-2 type transport system permease protein [Cytobacillus purgationiresistens]